jgi:hypothetical protein
MSERDERRGRGAPGPVGDGGAPGAGSSALGAAERILALADDAVDAIAARTEQEVRKMAAGVEVAAAEEALRRRVRLERLRGDLAERASALAAAYAEALGLLAQVDGALQSPGEVPLAQRRQDGSADPRIAAIKVTLRERQRIGIASERVPPELTIVPPGGEPYPAAPVDGLSRRPWWRLWERAAA